MGIFHIKIQNSGDFLAGQQLTHCASKAEEVGPISGWGTKIPQAEVKK